MHKRRVNELKLKLVIEPAGPLLIKSGGESGADPTLPTMNFVRTQHPQNGRRTIYLPGSSLKGVIRSHSERIIHTVLGEAPTICCDPLDRRFNCAERIRQAKITETDEQYRALCLACRIFGHMVNASHFFSADAYPAEAINELPVRHNVAIDRLSGGVAVGPFDMEVALEGKFATTLTLSNFELWQVGLLALALRDISEGRVRLGFAKSRGLGEVKLSLAQLEVGYPGQFGTNGHTFDQTLYGVSALAADLQAAYGYVPYPDSLAYPTRGAVDETGAMWGRPFVRFGSPAQNPALLSAVELEEAHGQVTAVLAATVSAWASFATHKQGGG